MRDNLIMVSHRDRFGNFTEIETPAAEAELGWRAYFGLIREEMFPKTTIELRYYAKWHQSGATRT